MRIVDLRELTYIVGTMLMVYLVYIAVILQLMPYMPIMIPSGESQSM